MKKATIFLITILTFTSCKKSNEASKIVGADWLLGKWENKMADGKLEETWKKVNDSLFIGESYFIKEKDTLHSEKMELKQKGENLFYISTIKGQNNDKPIIFNHKIEIEKQLVFENLATDYPRKIVYNPIAKDSIFIEVSGIQQDKPSSIRYSMKKTE